MSDQFIANWLRRTKLRRAFGYLLAVASVGLAFVAATTFLHYHLPLAIMSFSFCAIAITFWYAGIGRGTLRFVLVVLIGPFFSSLRSIGFRGLPTTWSSCCFRSSCCKRREPRMNWNGGSPRELPR